MHKIKNLRFLLEIISVPIFLFLVIHMAGHGMTLILDPGHGHGEVMSYELGVVSDEEHDHHEYHEEEHDDEHRHEEHEEVHENHEEEDHQEGRVRSEEGEKNSPVPQKSLPGPDRRSAHSEERTKSNDHHSEFRIPHSEGEVHDDHGHGGWLNPETMMGFLLTLVFIWIWHRKPLKKLVPCSHEHCHDKTKWPHVLAIIALCLHFFPEASIRHGLMQEMGSVTNVIALIGFASHFLLDVVVAVLISMYWSTMTLRSASFVLVTVVWLISWHAGPTFSHMFPESLEGLVTLLSAFLIAMFIHVPHRPVSKCARC